MVADRLAIAQFEDLLQHELADPERFQSVEAKIAQARTAARAARELDAGKAVDVVTGEPVDKEVR